MLQGLYKQQTVGTSFHGDTNFKHLYTAEQRDCNLQAKSLACAMLKIISTPTPRTVDLASCQAALARGQVGACQGSHGAHGVKRAHTAKVCEVTAQLSVDKGSKQDLFRAALILYDLTAPVKGGY